VATKINKPVLREMSDVVLGSKRTTLIVELHPPNLITIREKRRKQAYDISVGGLYTKLVQQAVDMKKATAAKQKRKAPAKPQRGLIGLMKQSAQRR
jgi:hypothetical protein